MSQVSSSACPPKAEVIQVHIAARFMRVSARTVTRMIRRGELPAERQGPRKWAIRRSDLERFCCREEAR